MLLADHRSIGKCCSGDGIGDGIVSAAIARGRLWNVWVAQAVVVINVGSQR